MSSEGERGVMHADRLFEEVQRSESFFFFFFFFPVFFFFPEKPHACQLLTPRSTLRAPPTGKLPYNDQAHVCPLRLPSLFPPVDSRDLKRLCPAVRILTSANYVPDRQIRNPSANSGQPPELDANPACLRVWIANLMPRVPVPEYGLARPFIDDSKLPSRKSSHATTPVGLRCGFIRLPAMQSHFVIPDAGRSKGR